jgi:hypothetical protein
MKCVVEQSDKIIKDCWGTSDNKTPELKGGNIHSRVRGILTAMVRRDKRNMCILINVHKPPAEDNFCDKLRRVHKPVIVENYKVASGLCSQR